MAGKRRASEAPPPAAPTRKDKKQKTAPVPAGLAVLSKPKGARDARGAKDAKDAKDAKAGKTATTAKSAGTPDRAPDKQHAAQAPAGGVVPATPGMQVDAVVAPGSSQQSGREPSKKEPQAQTNKAKTTHQPQPQPQPPPPTPTLPLEPHAALLGALQPKHDVRVLSVLSSTRMEKRIEAVLRQLGDRGGGGGGGSLPPAGEAAAVARSAPAGVALLHARAPDVGKLLSVVEIAKRRIREGCFLPAAAAADGAPADASVADDTGPTPARGKRKRSKGAKEAAAAAAAARRAATSWFQYNRVYDVASPASPAKKLRSVARNGDNPEAEDEDEDEDGFAPMVHRLQAAAGGTEAAATQDTVITTYMSILLSRVPLPELHRDPDITVQSSADPEEVEYEEWIGKQVK